MRPDERGAQPAIATIDIMMPFYGRVDHFEAAVESVLAQTDPDWRLVVIDDHYPSPEAGRWLLDIGDPRIEYVRHESNVGINRNFQESVERSTADWVVVFGCDDVMHPGFVARIRTLVDAHPDAAMLHPGVRIIDEHGSPVRTLVDTAKGWYRPTSADILVLTGEDLAVSVTRGNWMNFPAVAWNGPMLRATGFRAGYDVVQDLALVIDLCTSGGSLVIDPVVTFDYRRHSGSVSSWKAADGSRFIEERAFFLELAERYRTIGWPRAARAARTHLSSRINALTRVPSALSVRDTASARSLLRHTFTTGG